MEKADWERFFGCIGMEPPLPENIEEVLNASCSFWPDKKVKETHLMVLIPETVDGNPFTINYLEELIQHPKSGYITKYRYYSNRVKEALGSRSYPSHWVLMTKDVIPYSKGKHYLNCCDMVAENNRKTGIHYELPNALDATASILMHYVKTGESLYSDNPRIYTYSQEIIKDSSPTIGNFSLEGLSVDYGGYACRGAAVARRL